MLNNILIIILFTLLIISIVNYNWILNDIEQKNFLYIKNLNQNKYKNINVITYTYFYPKNWTIDKCYEKNCNKNDNLFETKIKIFHDELYSLGEHKKILITKNELNSFPVELDIDDLNAISTINSQ
jgi:hypothetical protein